MCHMHIYEALCNQDPNASDHVECVAILANVISFTKSNGSKESDMFIWRASAGKAQIGTCKGAGNGDRVAGEGGVFLLVPGSIWYVLQSVLVFTYYTLEV